MKYGWLLLGLALPLPLAAAASGAGTPPSGARPAVTVPEARTAKPPVAAGRVRVTGGTFRPLYVQPGETTVTVASFLLDARPVTRAEFEAFVRAEPRWQRGRAPALFVGASYLADWAAGDDAGVLVPADYPVTNVSWFAARAYCAAQDARLPTTAEWEYAARADEEERNAAASPEFRQRMLELAIRRRIHAAGQGFTNAWGVADLHGGIIEWVSDFQSIFAGSDSRATSRHERQMTCAAGATTAGDAGDYAAFLRYAYRATIEGRTTTGTMGFRCARSLS